MQTRTRTPRTFNQIIAKTRAEARPYQERVITKAYDNFNNLGITSQLINSPTGSGKTIMGLAIARWLQDTHNIGIGWSAMRRNLLHQAIRANQEMAMGVKCLTPISMFDKNPPTHDAEGRPIKLLVVDEAQHDAASSMGHIHNVVRPDYILGMSATPYRTDKLKLCFQKVIQDAGIHALIQQNYLSAYHQYTIPEWTPETVANFYLADPAKWGKSVMYWLNETLARECLGLLKAAGVRAEFVYGVQSTSHREEILERFDRTKYGDNDPDGLDVLVNMFLLTEGWDCPDLKTAWVRDSGKGCTIQMAGRAFRKYPDVAYKQIVQSKNTRWPFQKTATPLESQIWIDDEGETPGWRSVKPSKITQEVANRAILTLATTQCTMPDFIAKKSGKDTVRRDRQQGESGLEQRPNTGQAWGDGGAFIH